jgi:subtilisin family serine protease
MAIALVASTRAIPTAFADDGRYIVTLRTARAQSMNDLSVSTSAFLAGATPLVALPNDNAVAVRLSSEQLSEVARHPEVASVEVDHPVHAFLTPNDPDFANLYGLNGAYGISAPAAWDTTIGSPSKIVAVIDTGADYNHEDLEGNIWSNPGEIPDNGIDDDSNGYIDDYHGYDFVNGDGAPMDDNGHGTHVSGTIAAIGDNGVGSVGIAWGTQVVAVKCLDSVGDGYTSTLVQSIDYVNMLHDAGVPIVAMNFSLGTDEYSKSLERAVKRAAARGIVMAAAAGNDTLDNDESPSYPANFDVPTMISVAATNSSGRLASYSNFGRSTVHIAAPGSGIYSLFPPALGDGAYGFDSGTSMATPHVTGVAALVAAANPLASGAFIRTTILATSRPLNTLSRKVVSGGLLDARAAVARAVSSGRGYRLRGAVRRNGRGVSKVVISVRSASGASYRRVTQTDAQGAFSLPYMSRGNYVVRASRPGYRFREDSVRVSLRGHKLISFTAR